MLDAFGYASLRTDRLQDWAEYGEKFLGLQLVDATRSALSFRMDDRKQRLLVQSGADDHHAFGWEVADATALDALAARLEAAKTPVRRLAAPTLQLRAVRDAIRFADPAGNVLEAFFGAEISPTPFAPGRPISGFRTGALGMGHVVLHVARADELLWFYQDVLGFALSDYILSPFRAYFFHLNPRHHSLAMIETGKSGVHHMMLELLSLDDVGQAYDLASAVDNRIATTLGRHTNDYITSFYARSPDDFLIEYGWGGRAIEPKGWRPIEVTQGPSLWGHDRTWLPADQLAHSRALRAQAAAEGLRQPVQVIAGNYELMAGACPWWDGVRAAAGTAGARTDTSTGGAGRVSRAG